MMITEDKELKTIQRLESNMRHFQTEREILSNLFDRAKEMSDHRLAISVKTAIKGVEGILNFIIFSHNKLTVHHKNVEIVNLDGPPVLRLVVDNTKKEV